MRVLRIKRAVSSIADPPPPAPVEKGEKKLRFDARMDLMAEGVKKFEAIQDKETKQVLDYRDVTIKGYLSTFGGTDRDGDTVERGAFSETVKTFMRNPVLLIDHRNSVEYQAGSFENVREDAKGLYVEARLSNSSSEKMKHVRALVAEGHLKSMSMGGIFYYREDGRTIFKVALFEGSLTPVPANPDALISTRSMTEEDEEKLRLVTD